jgi:hypothetical protein
MRILHLAIVALVLAACGTDAGSSVSAQPGGAGTPTPPAGSGASGELVVTFLERAGGTPQRWTLRCDPPGGTHPDAQAACQALERASAGGRDPFAPVPKDMMCTEVYGGAQTATVTGTWRGRAVNGSFSRTNGCEIDRWDALRGLLPPGGAE